MLIMISRTGSRYRGQEVEKHKLGKHVSPRNMPLDSTKGKMKNAVF
jgi:hypothetical protein